MGTRAAFQHSHHWWTDRPRAWRAGHVAETLAAAGLEIDGPHPWDPQIHRPRTFSRIALGGTLGAGEAYVDGDWDCQALDELSARVVRAGLDRSWAPLPRLAATATRSLFAFGNAQSRRRAAGNAIAHYDIGDDLYEAMLGPTMAYSCGYWRDAATLDQAQEAKFDLVCRKLGLCPGMRLLDIGCGWGSFVEFAVRHYGVGAVGITVSPSQARHARTRCAGLDVDIRQEDYRDVHGRFDRIASIGMFEHVGPANYGVFFDTAARLLAPDGLMLLHTIGGVRSERRGDPWIDRYIFPHAVLPSAAQIARAVEGRFVIEDWHSFGVDYDRTLVAWHEHVDAAWWQLGPRYDERFRRTWRYYLLTCAGAFRARRNQLWQVVLSPRGVRGGYERP